MTLVSSLEKKLNSLKASGKGGPFQVDLTDALGHRLQLQIAQLDSLGCLLTELILSIPQATQAKPDDLKTWADLLSHRISYLLENIAPIEFDTQSGQAMIRSSPPGQIPQGAVYYEFVLESVRGGSVSLKRYRSVKGTAGRQEVEMQLTEEVLLKLVQDLIDTIPSTP